MTEPLEHFGVKGMRWGVRNAESTTGFHARVDGAPGVHPKTDNLARKHAEEFARAKMFYGQGAGTRRKLIKATVESHKKQDPSYAKAFDHHLARQNMGEHASKARSERARKNTVATGKKTTMAVLRRATGQYGNAAAAIAVGAAGIAYLSSPHGRRMMEKYIGAPN